MKVFVDDKEHQIVRYADRYGIKVQQYDHIQPCSCRCFATFILALLVRSGIAATFAATTAFILPSKIPSCSQW